MVASGGQRALPHVWLSVLVLGLASLACSLTSGTNSEPQTNGAAPLILWLAPSNNSVFAEGAAVEFYALVQDTQGRIARVEFRVDDVVLPDAPALTEESGGAVMAHAQWTASRQSKHILTVEAFRDDGLTLGMSDIVIEVIAPPGGGTVSGAASAATQPDAATSAPVSSPVPTPTSSEPQVDMGILAGQPGRVTVAELNVRQGPGTQYPSVGTLAQNDAIEIVGRNADSSWWAIAYRGGSAWVFADLVTVDGDASAIPLVASP